MGESRPPRIEFRSVGFGYDGTEVLNDVTFTLEPGTTTAIVGPSGSGKSTILSLIAGLHAPTRGRILVDGADVADTRPRGPTRRWSVWCFSTRTCSTERSRQHPRRRSRRPATTIHRAMALARVDDLIERLPDGALTKVGEAGTALSGGERQRVSIARALLKPAGVLLVDEATSALDTENEAAVVDAITDDPHRAPG